MTMSAIATEKHSSAARINRLRALALTTSNVYQPEPEEQRQEFEASVAGEPDLIRAAKQFAWTCSHRQIEIRPDELIVGANQFLRYNETAPKPASIGRQSFDRPWWIPLPETFTEIFRQGLISMAGNHMTMDYAGVFRTGLEGRIRQAELRKKRLLREEPGSDRKQQFLDALVVVARGYIHLCNRYGDLAGTMIHKAESDQRRHELALIATHCHRVPALPPGTFREACQCLWFCFLLVPDAPGRVDQYLYPFYEQDLKSGLITREAAKELLSCLWIRYFENPGADQAFGAIHHLTLGGVKPDGTDASNEITWICLEVTEELRLQRPQVALRWNSNTPDPLLNRAVKVLGTRCGSPDFSNDEQIIPALVCTGVSLEDARDFSLSGCNEVIITGKAQMGSVEGFINMPKILRTVLGLEPALRPGADLSQLTTFDSLWAALESEMKLVADSVHQISVVRDQQAASDSSLTSSLVVEDCIEKACGYNQGGARYNHCNWDIIGIANLADSLAVIRRLVFEDQVMSLGAFVSVLRSDWDGQEPLRRRIINEFPHFGNDDDTVDQLAAGIVERFSDLMKQNRPFRGGEYLLGTLSGIENMHIEFGRVTGATPDGRKTGEPLADSMGAAQGRDHCGVTALLNSVAKLPHRLLPTASTLNVRLAPEMIANEERRKKLAALIRGHFLSGGQHMQINLISREMLLDAQLHPDQHSDLMVRVAGYSAPFVSLWQDLQAEVISRTEHGA